MADSVIWMSRECGNFETLAVQDHFEIIFLSLGALRDMLLIAVDNPGSKSRIFASARSTATLAGLESFTELGSGSLPKKASLLIGHQDAFQERFRIPR